MQRVLQLFIMSYVFGERHLMRDKLELLRVTKKYGNNIVLNDVSLRLPVANMVINGGNGQGKTTLFKMLADIDKPTSGKIILPKNIARASLSSDAIVYPDVLTGLEVVRLYQRESSLNMRMFNRLSTEYQLSDLLHLFIPELSTGTLQKLRIAIALSLPNPLLLFDEPLNALDEDSRDFTLSAIVNDGRCFWVIDHQRRFDFVVDYKLIIEDGKCNLET